MTADHRAPVPVLTGAAEFLSRYDVVFCDVWGVVHNGVRAYDAAGDALARFRKAGGTVVLLSNAPSPSSTVAPLLDSKGVRRDAWDALVTSGDITRAYVRKAGFRRVHHIGEPRDLPVFEGLDTELTTLPAAEAIVCTGLIDDINETGEHYRPLLLEARERSLPLVCANPDLVVEVGGVLYPCAGAIATIYEDLGGSVFWAGKPHIAAYETALNTATQILGRTPARDRILGIGDAIRTDIAGADGFGIDSLMIAHGIHAAELLGAGALDEHALARLVAAPAPRPTAAMPALAW